MKLKLAPITGVVFSLGLAASGITSANAASFTLGDITVTENGMVDLSAPVVVQPSPIAVSGDFIGQVQTGSPGTLPGNAGWDPYGTSDTTHLWWNVYQGWGQFAFSGSTLGFLWGSPNYNDPHNSNYLTFYSGNTPIGTITANDLYTGFSGLIDNNNHPGYLLSFASSTPFTSVAAGNIGNASDFEFAFTAGVPEPTTWAMMIAGFASVAFLGFRRKRQPVALTL